jgi:ribonuclease G
VKDMFDGFPAAMRPDLELLTGAEVVDVFRTCGVPEPEIEFLSRVSVLASGAWLAFDRTEALTVVDVNTGHASAASTGCHGQRTDDSLALSVNLEAAREVARHIVARGITGAIVVDFIGLGEASSRRKVVSTLRDALSVLGADAQVGAMSALGLVEVGRRGGAASLDSRLCESCPACGAMGRRLTDMALIMLAERRIRRIVAQRPAAGDLLIGVSERLMALLAQPQYTLKVTPTAISGVGVTINFAALSGSAPTEGRRGEGDVLFDDLALEVLS